MYFKQKDIYKFFELFCFWQLINGSYFDVTISCNILIPHIQTNTERRAHMHRHTRMHTRTAHDKNATISPKLLVQFFQKFSVCNCLVYKVNIHKGIRY